jgi:hypothetical protein
VLVEILEGEVLKGEAKGFVRKIKSARGTSFLGDLDGERPLGKGIFIEDYEVVFQGKWSAQQEKYTEEPQLLVQFTSFDPMDNGVVVDEDALGEERMNKAYDLGYSFLNAMSFAPEWRKYGDAKTVQDLYEDDEAAGGPVTQDLRVKETDRWLYTPLATEFWDYLDRVAEAAYDGAEVGGFVTIRGLEMGSDEDDTLAYVDVILYCTAGEQGYAHLKTLNGTDAREMSPVVKWADVAQAMTGLGRMVKYQEKVNPYAQYSQTSHGASEPEWEMVGMFEGAIAKGRVNAKFGRLISNNGDLFLGFMTGDPIQGAWNAHGKGVWYSDWEFQAMGVW